MKRFTCLVAVGALLQGCAGPAMSAKAARMIEADEAMVKGCRMVGVVKGVGQNGASTEFAIIEAKNDAFEKAEERGATHVVYRAGGSEIRPVSGVSADCVYVAYRCTGTAQK